jgi:hypothetical protein
MIGNLVVPNQLRQRIKETSFGLWIRRFPGALLWTLDVVGVLPALRRVVSEENYLTLLTRINPFSTRTEARLFSERKLMVRFRDRKGGKVLIVGFHQGNIHYSYYYSGYGNPVYLIDNQKSSVFFQGRGKGIVGSICEREPLRDLKFTLVDFIGVYTYGLETQAELYGALDTIYHVLEPGGIALFGHSLRNDPLRLIETYSEYFSRFEEILDEQLPYVRGNQVRRVFRKPVTPAHDNSRKN